MLNNLELMVRAELVRKKLGADSNSPVDIFALVRSCEKLTLVFYPMGENISGICVKGSAGKCLIALNSTMTLGRQRFSLAHELYHYFYDDNMITACTKTIGLGGEKEREADAFASFFLVPQVALISKLESLHGKLELKELIELEQYFGISHRAAVLRLCQVACISETAKDGFLSAPVKSCALSLGFSDELYKPLPDDKLYCTYGYYIKQVEQLKEKALISDGKFEELLLDAFRYDLVYGNDEEESVLD